MIQLTKWDQTDFSAGSLRPAFSGTLCALLTNLPFGFGACYNDGNRLFPTLAFLLAKSLPGAWNGLANVWIGNCVCFALLYTLLLSDGVLLAAESSMPSVKIHISDEAELGVPVTES